MSEPAMFALIRDGQAGARAYAGQLIEWVSRFCHWVLAIVKRGEGESGFMVLPRRLNMERTFGWAATAA